jgi:SET domain-containing protein
MRRVIVRRSSVHGKGVFATKPLAAGERVLQYKGEITSWRNAVRRHQREGVEGHTFLFGLSDGSVIDGSRGGNSARWLNIPENPRGRKTPKRGRKQRFEPAIFEERFRTIERIFAWEDKFRRLLLRFERISDVHYALQTLAYTMINLRHYCRN